MKRTVQVLKETPNSRLTREIVTFDLPEDFNDLRRYCAENPHVFGAQSSKK